MHLHLSYVYKENKLDAYDYIWAYLLELGF